MSGFEYEDRLTITTPEGVELSLTLAGVGSRFIAAVIDALLELVTLGALAALVFPTNGFGLGANAAEAAFVVALFAVFWGYDVAFEVLAGGRTLGKRWSGLRVIREGGQPIGFLASTTRNLLRIVDWLPSGYLIGIIAILVSGKNQRLGDIVAGTIVVRELPSPITQSLRAPAPPATPAPMLGWDVSAISPEELATVRRFLDRRAEIGPDARHELAATLASRLRLKAAGVPPELGSEEFLELLVAAKTGGARSSR
jgi:uncharacterized RDD family membrane protein YckC